MKLRRTAYSDNQKIVEIEVLRNFSDDLGKIYYITCWLLFTLIYAFKTDAYMDSMLFYLFFDICAIIYLFLDPITKKEMGYTGFLKVQKDLHTHFGSDFIWGIIWSIFGYFILVVCWEFFLEPIFPIIPYASPSNDITFQIVRTIPAEEMVFRGALVSLFYLFVTKLALKDESDPKVFRVKYYIAWISIAIITGIIFGVYHIPSKTTEYYPYILTIMNGIYYLTPFWVPIVYLSLLGILLGFIKARWGLTHAIIVHILNNFIALAMIGFIYIF